MRKILRGAAFAVLHARAMSVPLGEAIVLGVIQGITEFLPISSDGHLAVAQMLYGGEADLPTTVFLHLGTLAATLLVLRKRVTAAVVEGVRGLLRPALLEDTPGGRDALVVILASIPTAIVGLALKGPSEAWSNSPVVVGFCFLGSAVAIGSTQWGPKDGAKDVPSRWGAVLVGVAQGSAVLPGLSRSAMTLATLLWLGVRGERAFELSFLMSMPAIAGAELLEARHAFHGEESVMPLVAGTVVAFFFGVAALMVLRGVLVRRVVAVFALYLVPIGVATLAWGWARP